MNRSLINLHRLSVRYHSNAIHHVTANTGLVMAKRYNSSATSNNSNSSNKNSSEKKQQVDKQNLLLEAQFKQFEKNFIDSENAQQEDPNDSTKEKESFGAKFKRNITSFAVFGFLSFGLAVALTTSDETSYYINNHDAVVSNLINIKDYELLTKRLRHLSEYSASNNTLRDTLAQPKYINAFLNIILEYSDLEINNNAAKVIDNIVDSATDFSFIPKLMEVSQLEYIPSYVRKTLASAISKIALKDEMARLTLASNGAIEFLDEILDNKLYRSKLSLSSLMAICSTCKSIPTTIANQSPKRQELIDKYSNQSIQLESNVLALKTKELKDSGLLLYLHTSAGGFAWGFFESLRNKYPIKRALLNGCKNSIITAAVPIFFVGLMTTLATREFKKLDSPKEKLYFYFGGLYSLFPWYYILPVVERFSPYWIGGHVIGFMSFFTYLAYSDYDLFKSDMVLIQKDRLAPPREVLKKQIEENKSKN
ncbi:hypothetical protein CYY_004414 [Polysphondylium violaceum]|uniref:Transmembrane protein n=1 Tax=Polysphondylium violaceum TaxID=133409 RepID=A0A8J4UT16_9MYCE|nr:hypothetical protein CYY_004414 [Polysphondylium violaceum]